MQYDRTVGTNCRILLRYCDIQLRFKGSAGEQGCDKTELEAVEYIVGGDLWKPKGMHWRTFYRLKMAEIAVDERMNNTLLAEFGHFL